MTIGEAIAVNEIADAFLVLAAEGYQITPGMEHGVGILLINANKVLAAGWYPERFFSALSSARKEAVEGPDHGPRGRCGGGIE